MERFLRRLLLPALLLMGCVGAFGAWPERPIRLVVPYSAGAMGDVLARLLADDLRNRLGQSVIVDNRPGAGGNIGTGAVAQAAPDGYTLLVAATNNFVMNQYLYPQLGFDPLTALAPITVLADVPAVIFINAEVPARTVSEFAAYAKAHPAKVNFGSPGSGTPPHLAGEQINRALGLGMAHVGYRGSAQALTALLSNEIQFYLVGAGLGLPHVRSGKLRALAVSGAGRLALMPDTPTFEEAGLRDVQARTWWAVAAPAGTPPEILSRLSTAFIAAIKAPAMQARLAQLGAIGVANSPEQMAKQLADESRHWSRAIREMGVKAD